MAETRRENSAFLLTVVNWLTESLLIRTIYIYMYIYIYIYIYTYLNLKPQKFEMCVD